jgi:hypothetical protein
VPSQGGPVEGVTAPDTPEAELCVERTLEGNEVSTGATEVEAVSGGGSRTPGDRVRGEGATDVGAARLARTALDLHPEPSRPALGR